MEDINILLKKMYDEGYQIKNLALLTYSTQLQRLMIKYSLKQINEINELM